MIDRIRSFAIPGWVAPLLFAALLTSLCYAAYRHGCTTTAASKDLEIAALRLDWSEQTRMAGRAVLIAQGTVAESERRAAEDIADLTAKARKEIQHEKNRADRFAAELRAGAERLSVPVDLPAACRGGGAESSAATAGVDGAGRAYIQGEAAARIVAIVDDADALAIRHAALQGVVERYRRLCSADPENSAMGATESP